MKFFDITRAALANSLRSKMRTFLTVIAIVIGAFTLTLTSGLGAGINTYVDQIVEGVGDSDQVYVMAAQQQSTMPGDSNEPVEYEENDDDSSSVGELGITMLSEDDIDKISDIDNIEEVNPVVFVSADYLQTPDDTKYVLDDLGLPSDTQNMELLAGERPDPAEKELIIPSTWLTAFGLDDDEAEDVVGKTVDIAVTDLAYETQKVEAEVVGVSEQLLSGIGEDPTPSQALNDELYDTQNSGIDGNENESENYAQVIATVENIVQNEQQVKDDLLSEDFLGTTVEDELGTVKGVINAVTWILNGFALIALLAASFGIVNTLLMSVQERTREIGLMKALGMTSRKVFALFSMEAILIGVMGSIIGVGIGLGVGIGGNTALVQGPLSDVAGLTLFAIDPGAILAVIALIIVIAFIAGTLPARRASKKNPITALRYE